MGEHTPDKGGVASSILARGTIKGYIMRDYYINKHGIYWTESAYGDSVDYHFVVDFCDFEEGDVTELTIEFRKFCDTLRKEGAKQAGSQIASLLGLKVSI